MNDWHGNLSDELTLDSIAHATLSNDELVSQLSRTQAHTPIGFSFKQISTA